MKISPLLAKILSEALLSVRRSNHVYLTPEHILSAALEEDIICSIIEACGSDPAALKNDIDGYLKKKIPVKGKFGVKVDNNHPIETAGFQSIMNRAVFHCVASDRAVVDITDVLLSMLDEKKNFCSYYMHTNGIVKSRLTEVIARVENMKFSGQEQENNKSEKTGQTSVLEKFCTDMNVQAKNGMFDRLIGREEEIERTIQILCRRVKNNPLHVGDAGVGKTAVTQGLVDRIVKGAVPQELCGCSVYALDIGLLLAGAKFRGDFEERIHVVINELAKKKKSILFIDEIHMIMGAGTNGNTNIDAANLLKPFLASGKIRCIGSTTFEEYAKKFEKDRALVRRFQKIDINEPSRTETIKILKGLLPNYEAYHGVKYNKTAVEAAVDLSVQFLTSLRLPDKAIDIIDEAGAFVKIKCSGGFSGSVKLFSEDYSDNFNPVEDAQTDNSGMQVKSGLSEQEKAMPYVNTAVIRRVVSKMAHVPIESLTGNERESLKNLEKNILSKIFGQDEAVSIVVKAVKRSRAGLKNPERPDACFLFAGPTGVGKTELARVLASALGLPVLRYDMSEYQEKHSLSRFIGSPPGYIGYDEGGILTSDVRKNPHSVILFDEIEKADQDIYNIFLQIMDYGVLTDNQGRKADFRNCIIIMTSNAGAADMEKKPAGFGSDNLDTALEDKMFLKHAVEQEFSPEFRNRLDAVVPFLHLKSEIILNIVRKEYKKLAERFKSKKVQLSISSECENYLAQAGYSHEFGARNLSRFIEEKIASPLADEVLFGRLSSGGKVCAELSKKHEENGEARIDFIFSSSSKIKSKKYKELNISIHEDGDSFAPAEWEITD